MTATLKWLSASGLVPTEVACPSPNWRSAVVNELGNGTRVVVDPSVKLGGFAVHSFTPDSLTEFLRRRRLRP